MEKNKSRLARDLCAGQVQDTMYIRCWIWLMVIFLMTKVEHWQSKDLFVSHEYNTWGGNNAKFDDI